MYIYILNFILIIIYSLIIKKKKNLVLLISLQLFLILALREETVGVDLVNYSEYFYFWQKYSFKEMLLGFRPFGGADISWGLESGYVLFNWILGKLGLSFHTYLVICAFICVFSLGRFIYKYSEDPAISFVLFLALGGYSYFFGILRQSLGLAIFLFAISALKQRNFRRYMLLVFLAQLFHSVFLVMLPLYFLGSVKIRKKHFYLMFSVSFIIVAFGPLIYSILAPIVSRLGKNYNLQVFQWNNMFLLMIILAVFIMVFYKYRSSEEDSVLVWGYLCALPVQAIGFYVPIFSRVAIGIFASFVYIIFANVLKSISKQRQAYFIKMVAYTCMFIFYVYTLADADIVPYYTFF